MTTVQTGMRIASTTARVGYRAYRSINRLYDFLSIVQTMATAGSSLAAGDVSGAVKALIGVSPDEIKNIREEFRKKGLSNLSKQAIGALGVVDFDFSLSSDSQRPRKRGKIAKALSFVQKTMGYSNRATEVIGEIGTGLMMSIIGFDNPGLDRRHKKHGPDFILQHRDYSDAWAVVEAKGGTSKLGTSTLSRPVSRRSAGVRVRPGEGPRFQQMGARWIEYWLRLTIDKNAGSIKGQELDDSFDNSDPMLAVIVSVNLNRKKEIRIAAQPFAPPRGTLFNDWPRGF